MARPRSRRTIDGVVLVDKPAGSTSHDAVQVVRRVLGERRAGHAGTLDPDATGLLVIGLGQATRLLRFATGLPKSYVGEVVLGSTTDTLDAAGTTTAVFDMSSTTLAEVRAAALGLTGRILQVPPMVSALKVEGRRLYELAREGIEIERAPRPVEVHRLEVSPTAEPGVFRIDVECSSGTYVRSLAADLGSALGGGAHLRALRRSAIGPFRVEDAPAPTEVSDADVRAPGELVAHLDELAVGGELREPVAHGQVLERRVLGAVGDGPWALVDADSALLAVYEPFQSEKMKPLLVLARPAGRPGADGDGPAELAGGAR